MSSAYFFTYLRATTWDFLPTSSEQGFVEPSGNVSIDSSAPEKSATIINVALLSQMNLFHDKARGVWNNGMRIILWGETWTQAVPDGVKELLILLGTMMAVWS